MWFCFFFDYKIFGAMLCFSMFVMVGIMGMELKDFCVCEYTKL